jgi:hypothetical protein
MSTLKEEIKEELTYFPINKTGDYELVSEKILKAIEKRLDSRIKELHFLDDAIKIDELKEVKEMLK